MLLYLVVKCRNSKGLNLEERMRFVFDQHTEMDHNGVVTGGDGKLLCLHNMKLGEKTVRKLVKTPCRNIIEELRDLFWDFYLVAAEVESDDSEDSDSGDLPVHEDERRQGSRDQTAIRVREATKKLSSSEWILEMINRYLSFKWDADDDGSLHKTTLRPDSAASRDRRKRKAEGKNEDKMSFNKRRKGRLPPPSIEPPRDTLWTQGTHSRSHANTPTPSETLLGSSSHSATRVSTRSQSLRSYSRSSKATSTHGQKL